MPGRASFCRMRTKLRHCTLYITTCYQLFRDRPYNNNGRERGEAKLRNFRHRRRMEESRFWSNARCGRGFCLLTNAVYMELCSFVLFFFLIFWKVVSTKGDSFDNILALYSFLFLWIGLFLHFNEVFNIRTKDTLMKIAKFSFLIVF